MRNLNRLYLISGNLGAIKDRIAQYNIFDNVGFAQEIQVMEIQINRMQEILEDMEKEKK